MKHKETNAQLSKSQQPADKTKPSLDIKTNIKAGYCCDSGWSDRNVKENFVLVDSFDVLAAVLED